MTDLEYLEFRKTLATIQAVVSYNLTLTMALFEGLRKATDGFEVDDVYMEELQNLENIYESFMKKKEADKGDV